MVYFIKSSSFLGVGRASRTPASSPQAHLPRTPGRSSLRDPDGSHPAHPPFPVCTALRRVSSLTSPRVGLRARARPGRFLPNPVPAGRAAGVRSAGRAQAALSCATLGRAGPPAPSPAHGAPCFSGVSFAALVLRASWALQRRMPGCSLATCIPHQLGGFRAD